MYVLRAATGQKWLAWLFALFAALAAFGIGNMTCQLLHSSNLGFGVSYIYWNSAGFSNGPGCNRWPKSKPMLPPF